jgi:hypothetical protein
MQQTFLQEVAEKLYKQYGNSISELTIVLPSRRAQLFFSEALTHIVQGGAIWQPNYVSIDELMCEASSYKLGDKIRIVCELHKIYSNYHKETLDKFYFWGETLLSDFDLVDKYMVDADMLFCNLHDLKEIETHFPDDETWEVIRRFWQHFSQEETLPEHKEKFLNIWKSLGPVYHALRERLAELNFAYQGMVYRSAAENLESGIVRLCHGPLFCHFLFASICQGLFKFLDRKGAGDLVIPVADSRIQHDSQTHYQHKHDQNCRLTLFFLLFRFIHNFLFKLIH